MKVAFTTKLKDLRSGYAFVFAGVEMIDDNVWVTAGPFAFGAENVIVSSLPDTQRLIIKLKEIKDDGGKILSYGATIAISNMEQAVVPLSSAALCI